MLLLDKTVEGDCMTVVLSGEIDTIASVKADREIGEVAGFSSVVLDMADVTYITSAGIRVLLSVRKRMSPGAKLSLQNLQPIVRHILELSGLTKLIAK